MLENIVLAEWFNEPWAILIFIIVIFGVLALGVFLLSKFVINKKDKEEKPDENTIAKENLSRYLEEVDNPETQKQFDEYNQENKDK